MISRSLARRLLRVWFVSVLLLTLAPFGTLRPEPLGLAWRTPTLYRLTTFDFVANVLLFAPLGVLGTALGRPRWLLVAAAFTLSFSIEYLQGYIAPRHPSWLDVLANTAAPLVAIVTPIRAHQWLLSRVLRLPPAPPAAQAPGPAQASPGPDGLPSPDREGAGAVACSQPGSSS